MGEGQGYHPVQLLFDPEYKVNETRFRHAANVQAREGEEATTFLLFFIVSSPFLVRSNPHEMATPPTRGGREHTAGTREGLPLLDPFDVVLAV